MKILDCHLFYGAANNGKPTPVDLRLDVEGDLQESLNIALRAAGILNPAR